MPTCVSPPDSPFSVSSVATKVAFLGEVAGMCVCVSICIYTSRYIQIDDALIWCKARTLTGSPPHFPLSVSSVATTAEFLGGVAGMCVCVNICIYTYMYTQIDDALIWCKARTSTWSPPHLPLSVSSVATKAEFLGGVAGIERNEHGGTTAWFTVPLAPTSVRDVSLRSERASDERSPIYSQLRQVSVYLSIDIDR